MTRTVSAFNATIVAANPCFAPWNIKTRNTNSVSCRLTTMLTALLEIPKGCEGGFCYKAWRKNYSHRSEVCRKHKSKKPESLYRPSSPTMLLSFPQKILALMIGKRLSRFMLHFASETGVICVKYLRKKPTKITTSSICKVPIYRGLRDFWKDIKSFVLDS